MSNGVDPSKILVITLTNRASFEFQARLENIVGVGLAQSIKISTVHSYCQEVVTANAAEVGFSSTPLVVTSSDQKMCSRIVNRKLKHLGIKNKDFSYVLRNKLDPTRSKTSALNNMILEAYNQEIHHHKLLDYADMIIYAKQLLKQLPELSQEFEHILVDEFQDISRPLWDVIYGVSKNASLFVVGDPNQSIFGFAGASPELFHTMATIFKDTQVVKLVKNYRSTSTIVDTFNEILLQNGDAHFRVPLVSGLTEEGIKPQLQRFDDPKQELKWISNEIKSLLSKGMPVSDVAILLRAGTSSNYFLNSLSENLKDIGVKPIFFGGKSVFSTDGADLCSAILRLLRFPDRNFFVLGLIREYKKFITESELEKMLRLSEQTGSSLYSLLQTCADSLTAKKAEKLHEFVKMVIDCQAELQKEPRNIDTVIRVLRYILNQVEYVKHVLKPETKIQEIHNLFQFLQDNSQKIGSLLVKYPNKSCIDILLMPTLIFKEENQSDQLVVSTVHSAKGLQWKTVFMPQIQEENIPYYNPVFQSLSSSQIEEERRVFYVGITRAKQRLYLSYSNEDKKSRFLSSNVIKTLDTRSHVPKEDHKQFASLFKSPIMYPTRCMKMGKNSVGVNHAARYYSTFRNVSYIARYLIKRS